MIGSCALPFNACVISLERTPERLESFRQRLGPIAADVHWHAAIDGSILDCDELVQTGILDASALTWPRGQIGCALSHLSTWQACIQSSQPLLIFEDDVQLAKDWIQRLESLAYQLVDKPWDVLLLGCNQDSCMQIEWSSGHSLTALFRPRHNEADSLADALDHAGWPKIYRLLMALGLAGYVVSPQGASRLIEWACPLRTLPIQNPELPNRSCYSLDGQLNAHYSSIQAFIAFPPIAIGENNQIESLTRV